MAFCSRCGAQADGSAAFCNRCGAPLDGRAAGPSGVTLAMLPDEIPNDADLPPTAGQTVIDVGQK